jgi:hypothetical protein
MKKGHVEHILLLSTAEYRIFWLLVNQLSEAQELPYQKIAASVYGCELDHDLLMLIRRRVSSLRKQLSSVSLDIINIPHYGYELRTLACAAPYRRGARAKVGTLAYS